MEKNYLSRIPDPDPDPDEVVSPDNPDDPNDPVVTTDDPNDPATNGARRRNIEMEKNEQSRIADPDGPDIVVSPDDPNDPVVTTDDPNTYALVTNTLKEIRAEQEESPPPPRRLRFEPICFAQCLRSFNRRKEPKVEIDSPNNTDSEISGEIGIVIKQLEEYLGVSKNIHQPVRQCCIYKVPIDLRKINEEAYTPQMISIGPFHHHKYALMEMEQQKLRYILEFTKREGVEKLEEFRRYIEANEKNVRNYYQENPSLMGHSFVNMILCDTVFIIEFFLKNANAERKQKEEFDFFLDTTCVKATITRDLQLLENQLPYFLLKNLFEKGAFHNFTKEVYPDHDPFLILCHRFFFGPKPINEIQQCEIQHFTDLRRHFLLKDFLPRGQNQGEHVRDSPTAGDQNQGDHVRGTAGDHNQGEHVRDSPTAGDQNQGGHVRGTAGDQNQGEHVRDSPTAGDQNQVEHVRGTAEDQNQGEHVRDSPTAGDQNQGGHVRGTAGDQNQGEHVRDSPTAGDQNQGGHVRGTAGDQNQGEHVRDSPTAGDQNQGEHVRDSPTAGDQNQGGHVRGTAGDQNQGEHVRDSPTAGDQNQVEHVRGTAGDQNQGEHVRDSPAAGDQSQVEHVRGTAGDQNQGEHVRDSPAAGDQNQVEHLRGTAGDQNQGEHVRDLPTATKLHGSGVKFKKGNQSGSSLKISCEYEPCAVRIPCFKGYEIRIPFIKELRLQIPRFEIDDKSECLYRNMMALELCHYPSETHICNFIILMDFLINTEKDVDLFVEEGIIFSLLGDNAAVANMFNYLGLEITPSFSVYHNIGEKLKAHYARPWNRTMATLKTVYFGDVWKGSGTVAAVMLLVLTLIQAVCSILSLTRFST